MRNSFGTCAIAFMIALCSAPLAFGQIGEAFYIDPMELTMNPNVSSVSTLEVFNKESSDTQIHVDIFERSDSVDGAEVRSLTKDLVADATEFRLGAGQSRKLALQYKGSKKTTKERAFRIVVRQLAPLKSKDTSKDASNDVSLDVRFVYVASLYVVPAGAEAKLVIQQVRRISEREVGFTLSNHGRSHAQLSNYELAFLETESKGQREIQLSAESRDNWSRQVLMAGSRRKLRLQIGPNEAPIRDGALDLKFTRRDSKRSSE